MFGFSHLSYIYYNSRQSPFQWKKRRYNYGHLFWTVCICWLTFIDDGDGFLRNDQACSPDCFCIQIKLVARAVLEVQQSDWGLIGGQRQLLHWAQLIGVIDDWDGGWGTGILGRGWRLGSNEISWIEGGGGGGGHRWGRGINDEKGGSENVWGSEVE